MNFAFRTTDHASLLPDDPRDLLRSVRIEIVDTLAAAEGAWRKLLEPGSFATPYQHYDWCALWFQHVGQPAGMKPFVVIGYDTSGEPLFLWPLVRSTIGPFHVATFFCGSHSNFSTTLWRGDIVTSITADDLRGILQRISGAGIDLLMLRNQPLQWRGVNNPLACLPHQPSPDSSFSLTLHGSSEEIFTRQFNADTRRKYRRKERHLAKLRDYRYVRATSPADVDRYIDTFMIQKAARLSARGLGNVFHDPGVEAFLRAACHKDLASGQPLVELHALEGDGELLALFSGIHDRQCFTTMFNSYTLGSQAKMSPGLSLLLKLIDNCVGRGFTSFNLGTGAAEYKSSLCDTTEHQFDSFIGLTLRGRIFAMTAGLIYAFKGKIKSSAGLSHTLQMIRQPLNVIQRLRKS